MRLEPFMEERSPACPILLSQTRSPRSVWPADDGRQEQQAHRRAFPPRKMPPNTATVIRRTTCGHRRAFLQGPSVAAGEFATAGGNDNGRGAAAVVTAAEEGWKCDLLHALHVQGCMVS